MAFPTAVNAQITDAITQSNVKVVGESPALAISSVYQSLEHSVGIVDQNAAQVQQQQVLPQDAACQQEVMQIHSLGAAAVAGSAGTLE